MEKIIVSAKDIQKGVENVIKNNASTVELYNRNGELILRSFLAEGSGSNGSYIGETRTRVVSETIGNSPTVAINGGLLKTIVNAIETEKVSIETTIKGIDILAEGKYSLTKVDNNMPLNEDDYTPDFAFSMKASDWQSAIAITKPFREKANGSALGYIEVSYLDGKATFYATNAKKLAIVTKEATVEQVPDQYMVNGKFRMLLPDEMISFIPEETIRIGVKANRVILSDGVTEMTTPKVSAVSLPDADRVLGKLKNNCVFEVPRGKMAQTLRLLSALSVDKADTKVSMSVDKMLTLEISNTMVSSAKRAIAITNSNIVEPLQANLDVVMLRELFVAAEGDPVTVKMSNQPLTPIVFSGENWLMLVAQLRS